MLMEATRFFRGPLPAWRDPDEGLIAALVQE